MPASNPHELSCLRGAQVLQHAGAALDVVSAPHILAPPYALQAQGAFHLFHARP